MAVVTSGKVVLTSLWPASVYDAKPRTHWHGWGRNNVCYRHRAYAGLIPIHFPNLATLLYGVQYGFRFANPRLKTRRL